MASRPSKPDSRSEFQSEPGQGDMASRPSKSDFWWKFQSQPGQGDMASRPSKFDFWYCKYFNQSLNKVTWPACLQSLTLPGNFNQNLDKVTWPAGLQSLVWGNLSMRVRTS